MAKDASPWIPTAPPIAAAIWCIDGGNYTHKGVIRVNEAIFNCNMRFSVNLNNRFNLRHLSQFYQKILMVLMGVAIT